MTEDEAFKLLAADVLGGFGILLALRNTHDGAPDYAAQHDVGAMQDDPASQADPETKENQA